MVVVVVVVLEVEWEWMVHDLLGALVVVQPDPLVYPPQPHHPQMFGPHWVTGRVVLVPVSSPIWLPSSVS